MGTMVCIIAPACSYWFFFCVIGRDMLPHTHTYMHAYVQVRRNVGDVQRHWVRWPSLRKPSSAFTLTCGWQTLRSTRRAWVSPEQDCSMCALSSCAALHETRLKAQQKHYNREQMSYIPMKLKIYFNFNVHSYTRRRHLKKSFFFIKRNNACSFQCVTTVDGERLRVAEGLPYAPRVLWRPLGLGWHCYFCDGNGTNHQYDDTRSYLCTAEK